MLEDWVPVEDNIIRDGDMYSVEGFEPTEEDIARILEIVGDDLIGIGCRGKYVMVFENGEFLKSGEYFRCPLNPLYASPEECMILDLIEEGYEYRPKEIYDLLGAESGESVHEAAESTFFRLVKEGYLEKIRRGRYKKSSIFFP